MSIRQAAVCPFIKIVCFTLLAANTAVFAQTWECGTDLSAVLADGTLTISGSGYMDSYFVNDIPWNDYRNSIISVVIEYGVNSVGNYAFYDCNNLASVTIPNSVIYIGNNAFHGCSKLTSITVPGSVIYIGNSAFQGCGHLTSITVPGSVSYIRDSTFRDCIGLTDIIIGDGVGFIGNGAFSGCASLTAVTIPNGVTSIRHDIFDGCSKLETINVTSGNLKYSSIDGIVYNKNLDTLIMCPQGKTTVNIPENVISIGNSAFHGCNKLTSITIPNKMSTVGNGAFSGCNALSSLTVSGTGAMIDYSYASTNAPWHSLRNNITNIVIDGGLTSVGNSAFRDFRRLKSVTVSGNAAYIGSGAFDGCDSLTSITIPASVTEIGEMAFYNCSGLTSIISLNPVPPEVTGRFSTFYNVSKSACTLFIPANSTIAYSSAAGWKYFWNIEAAGLLSISSDGRVIPQPKPDTGSGAVMDANPVSAEFTAGPNPVAKFAETINFYRQGKRAESAAMTIFSASGNFINKVKISDNSFGDQSRRQVGSWNLKDSKNRTVSEGTYLIKGTIKTSDGKSEKVSLILGVW